MSNFQDTDEEQQQINLQTLVQQQQTHGAPTPVRSAAFTLKNSDNCCVHTDAHTHTHGHAHGSGHAQKRKQVSVAEDDNDELEKLVDGDEEEGPAKRKRRKQVERACSNCRRSKTACSSERPCKRCIGHGIESTCIDAPRKRRAKKAKLSLEDQFLWHEFSKFVGDTNVRPSAFMPPKLFGGAADSNAALFDAHAAAATMHQDPDNDDTNLGTVLKKRQRTKSLVKSGDAPAPVAKPEPELPSLYGSGASSPFFNAALYSGMGGLLPPHLQHLSAMCGNLSNNNNILLNDGSECDSGNESVPEFSHLLQDLWRPLRVPVQNVDFEGQRPVPSSSSSSSSHNAGTVLPQTSTTNFNAANAALQINMVPGFPAGPNPFSSSASARFPSDFFKFSASNNFLSAFGDGSQTLLTSQIEGTQNPSPSASPSTNPALPPGTSPIAVNPNGTHYALSNSPKSSFTLHFGLNESPANRQSLELFFQSLLAETGSQNPGFQPVA